MKSKIFGFCAVVLVLLMACSSDDGNTGGGKESSTGVSSVSLNRNTLNLLSGSTATLTATVSTDSDKIAQTVTWSTDDKSIATVEDGTVTAVAKGSAKITATSTADTSKNATCTVNVEEGNVYPQSITLSATELDLNINVDSDTKTGTLTATISNASNVTEGRNKIIWTSSDESVATVSSDGVVTGVKKGTATITAYAEYGTAEASCDVSVTRTANINLDDTPTGYAGYGYESSPYYTGSQTITINATDSDAASKLKEYAKKGSYVIYINGMIDVTEGKLPSAWDNDNAALGNFIASHTSNTYSSWSAWRTAYAKACDATSHKTTGSYTAKKTSALTSGTNNSTLDGYQTALVAAWKSQIQIVMASNTTIIGVTDESGIKGGNISISGVKNIMLRNLHLQDAFDPFPHHEYNDGWNAEWDCITIQNENSYIWIDHCTFEDTISVGWTKFAGVEIGTVGTGGTTRAYSESTKSTYEMWQTYDGLCDIKGKSKNITVSYCVFKNHDKTMLIGSSDDEFSENNTVADSGRTITLHHNYYYGCVQRLPMARLSYIHNFNNYYGVNSSNGYDQKAAVNARYGVYINSESNYFDSGLKYSYNSSDSTAYLYYANDAGTKAKSTSLKNLSYSTTNPVFNVPYDYKDYLDSASDLKSSLAEDAGAGVWKVKTN